MSVDLIVRNGSIIDGTGNPSKSGDIAIQRGFVVAIGERIDESAVREIDAEGRLVTPGFVDVHTHLDAQLGWDPHGAPGCWHGITSVVMGNCGVTLAPCRPGDRAAVAALIERAESIPLGAVLDGATWEWETFPDYLASLDRTPVGINVGVLIGHAAVRRYVMGDRATRTEPAGLADVASIAAVIDEALTAGALGVSTARTVLAGRDDGRTMPGARAGIDELDAIADVMRRHRRAILGSAARLGGWSTDDAAMVTQEMAWMADVSRRSGHPMTFGLASADHDPDLHHLVLDLTRRANLQGARLRPQTTARPTNLLFGLETRSPFDRCSSWRELRSLPNGRKLVALRDPGWRTRLIEEADRFEPTVNLAEVFIVAAGDTLTTDWPSSKSLAAVAATRGVCPAWAYIEMLLETDGRLIAVHPLLNRESEAIVEMLDDPVVALGLSDAGAHLDRTSEVAQTTALLADWVRDRNRWPIEEAVRRLTSDPAELFGLDGRGVLAVGARADLNVIDLDALTVGLPEFVRDLPDGGGRYLQRSQGYDYTIVNGEISIDHGASTGVLAGQRL